MDFIKDIGTNLAIGGFILVGGKDPIVVMRPNAKLAYDEPTHDGHVVLESGASIHIKYPSMEEFKKIVRQMDLNEVEICKGDGSKMIVRKTQRSTDKKVSWEVFKRDNYTCRYCGVKGGENGATLSYDHIKLWENNGEWSVENGVCACINCNRLRGNTDYEEWINGDIYAGLSKNLSDEVLQKNIDLISKYRYFPDKISKRRR